MPLMDVPKPQAKALFARSGPTVSRLVRPMRKGRSASRKDLVNRHGRNTPPRRPPPSGEGLTTPLAQFLCTLYCATMAEINDLEALKALAQPRRQMMLDHLALH